MRLLSHRPAQSRQALLEWDFFSTNEIAKVEMTKASYGPGPLMTNSFDIWHSQTKGLLEAQPIWLSIRCTPVHASSGLQRPERIFSLIIKLSFQDIEQDDRGKGKQ